jgi:hypothetical protein
MRAFRALLLMTVARRDPAESEVQASSSQLESFILGVEVDALWMPG